MPQQKLTPQQALPKIKQYCAYQERCHSEVREKLAGYGVYGLDADAIMAQLVAENYLNEERFAIQFAGGRFRLKQWGRIKIGYELKQKQVSAYCVKKALAAIDEADYQAMLEKLAGAKWATLKGADGIKKQQLMRYMAQKGYEGGLVGHWLRQQDSKYTKGNRKNRISN
jgi:regulatory protein